MTEPRRLFEEGTPFERELLASAMHDDPSAARRRNLVAAAAATSTALAAGGASGAGLAAWKVIAVAVALGSITVAVTRGRRDEVAPIDTQPSVIARTPLTLPPPSVAWTTATATTTATAASASAEPPQQQGKVAAVAAAPTASGPSLAREIAWIDGARAAVAARDSVSALRALDGYDRECAGGALAVEAEVLRVEATALSGNAARASSLGRAFLAAHPASPYAARVRKHVVEP